MKKIMVTVAAIMAAMAMTACKYEPLYEEAPEKKNDGKMVAMFHYGHAHYVLVLKEESEGGTI